ncbi:MAG: acyltransferase family protein [Porcipelethomonas sp.]
MESAMYSKTSVKDVKKRDSSIELFRIITMMIIVASHYVINFGLMDKICENPLSPNSIFLLLFGWGGKTGINCFVMITGYFMCKSNITVKKFLKLLLEYEFYKIVGYIIFLSTGYIDFSIKGVIKELIPIYNIGTTFTKSYLLFFLFIPFLNILINGMNEKQHISLIGLCLLIYTVFSTFFMANAVFSYVSWFMIIYFISSYIRIYPKDLFNNNKIWGSAALLSVLASWLSVIAGAFVSEKLDKYLYFYFVNDSNKIMAVVTAICAFMFFKNLKLKYNRIINTIAASSFGVLLIHANSDAMRNWLWRDVFDNVRAYDSHLLILHAFASVIIVYAVCTVIDLCRIKFIEKPFFRFFDARKEKKAG